MKIKRLIKEIEGLTVKGSKEIELTGLCSDSRFVGPGYLFIAKKGRKHDGNAYLLEASQAGAAALVTDVYDPSLKHITQLIHPNAACIEGQLAARFYQEPSSQLLLVGITGTNGKTTTAAYTKYLLEKAGVYSGLIGTIEYIIGPHRHQATHTTPDVCSNHKMLSEMVREGCTAAVMEVTSHALDQNRTANLDFDIAVFTNLSPEHLDYHKSMQEYAAAKRRLFQTLQNHTPKQQGLTTPVAIVNSDCPWHEAILDGCYGDIVRYGFDPKADLCATEVELKPRSSSFTLSFKGESARFCLPFPGRFNIQNALAAIAVGLTHKNTLAQLAASIKHAPPVPGRLQPVPNTLGIRVFVDFAHTTDALHNVLSCLKELQPRRIINVFGCGGERDPHKRTQMAAISEELCDFTIITSDNPRSEDPLSICEEIAAGFQSINSYCIEPNRYAAIEQALLLAKPEDMVVIAGRGHETHQVLAHKTIPFSDWHIASQLCQEIAKKPAEQGAVR